MKSMSREKFLELAAAQYEAISKLEDSATFLEHEEDFVKLWTEFGRQVIECQVNSSSIDRRKKKR